MSLSRPTCSECPRPVEGRAITCSGRCRTARSRRLSSARAADRLADFEALLQDAPEEVQEAYAGLLEDVPALRETHARALARGEAPDEEPAYSSAQAIQAREWLVSWARSAGSGRYVGRNALFFEASDSWTGSRWARPVESDLFHTVAERVLVRDGDGYRVP